ncbi:ATPase AAA-type core domain-containing protein [Azospirillaceae bacterium]
MLEKIKISRFKSVYDVELDFGKVNLLIGGNGAGKSNVLEAIGVLSAALRRGVSNNELSSKGVRLTPPALMKSAFKNLKLPLTLRIEGGFSKDISYTLDLTARDDDVSLAFFSEKGSDKGEQIFSRSGSVRNILGKRIKRELDRYRGIWDQAGGAFEFSDDVLKQFDAMARFAVYAPQTEFLREIKTGTVDNPPIGLHGEGLASAVASLLTQLSRAAKKKDSDNTFQRINDALKIVWVPGWARQVHVDRIQSKLKSTVSSSSDGKTVYFVDKYMNEKRNTLSAYDSSEGTLFILFIAILLAHSESPPIFAIDNIDSALNPSMTRALIENTINLIKTKAESGVSIGPDQIFMTSHNPTSLDAFDLFDPDQKVFVVARDDKGRTTATPLRPIAGMTRLDWDRAMKGKSLSQFWIDGDIKGALGIDGGSI